MAGLHHCVMLVELLECPGIVGDYLLAQLPWFLESYHCCRQMIFAWYLGMTEQGLLVELLEYLGRPGKHCLKEMAKSPVSLGILVLPRLEQVMKWP